MDSGNKFVEYSRCHCVDGGIGGIVVETERHVDVGFILEIARSLYL